jgi:hypothetical protein
MQTKLVGVVLPNYPAYSSYNIVDMPLWSSLFAWFICLSRHKNLLIASA